MQDETQTRKPALTVKVRRGLAEAAALLRESGRKIPKTGDLGTALAWIDGTLAHHDEKE